MQRTSPVAAEIPDRPPSRMVSRIGTGMGAAGKEAPQSTLTEAGRKLAARYTGMLDQLRTELTA